MFVVSGVAASKMTIRMWCSFTETSHIRSSTPRPLRAIRDGESASVPHCADAGHLGAPCYGQLSRQIDSRNQRPPGNLEPTTSVVFRVPGGSRGPTGFNLITWRNFYNGLQTMVALHNHPLESYEGRTLIYFSHFVDLVLNTINGRRRHQHFAVLDRLVIDIDQPRLPPIQQPQIHITVESGFVLTSNGEPFCIVELKRFIPQNRLFNNGRRQALVYAAALGHLRADGRPVLAIVTDLQRWQFFEVTDNPRLFPVSLDSSHVQSARRARSRATSVCSHSNACVHNPMMTQHVLAMKARAHHTSSNSPSPLTT